MDAAHLEKLRRFALASGLVLLTYLLAGITMEAGTHVSAFGIDFQIARPGLLPIGLALASLAGMVRFYYYGVMLGTSPYRRRRDLLDDLSMRLDARQTSTLLANPRLIVSGPDIPMYWGPRSFELVAWFRDVRAADKIVADFESAFPKFAGARVRATKKGEDSVDDDGKVYRTFSADAVVPRRCRIAAIFEDIDYTSPVWVNAIALLVFGWKLVRPG
jgi:hypothetical protein